MSILADIGVALVALLHVYFFVLESFLWDKPLGLRVFRLTPEFAKASKALAANQGVYNAFLAAGLAWGLTLLILRRIGRDDRSGSATVTALITGNLFACLAALPFALPLPDAPAAEWATLVYLGVFQIGLAYICLTTAFRRLPAASCCSFPAGRRPSCPGRARTRRSRCCRACSSRSGGTPARRRCCRWSTLPR